MKEIRDCGMCIWCKTKEVNRKESHYCIKTNYEMIYTDTLPYTCVDYKNKYKKGDNT